MTHDASGDGDTAFIGRGRSVAAVRAELARLPLLRSAHPRSWQGVSFDEFAGSKAEQMLAPPRDHHVIGVCLSDSPSIRMARCGGAFSGPARRGEAFLMPAGWESSWDGFLPANLRMSVSVSALTEAADAMGIPDCRRLWLTNIFQVSDPTIERIAAICSAELMKPPHPAQDLVLDGMALTLTGHLLSGYVHAAAPRPPGRTGPRGHAAVARAIEYIEQHPMLRVGLGELAAAAGLSKFHFSRVFTAETGVSPIRYIQKARINQARAFLSSGLSVAEVANLVGFADQSHFARAFRREVDCTPREFVRRSS